MICPKAYSIENESSVIDDNETFRIKTKKTPGDGTASLELNSFKNPKTWKKSISNFFRNQLRSTKSNDGDRPSGSNEQFEDTAMSPEQKWQSLGKIFKRQTFDYLSKSSSQQAECSSQNKRLAVKKALSNYFGKSQKSPSPANK